MVFNITEHVQGIQYLLRFWRSDGVLNLNTHFYSVVFDLFCIFRENTHEQQLIQAKILYQCPSRNILDFVYGGSHFSTGVIFLRVRHVKNRPLWHFFYTWDTFFYGQGSFLYDERWPLGRFSTGVVIRRYTGRSEKQDGRLGLWLVAAFSTSPLNRIQWNLTGSKISTSSIKFVFLGLKNKMATMTSD